MHEVHACFPALAGAGVLPHVCGKGHTQHIVLGSKPKLALPNGAGMVTNTVANMKLAQVTPLGGTRADSHAPFLPMHVQGCVRMSLVIGSWSSLPIGDCCRLPPVTH